MPKSNNNRSLQGRGLRAVRDLKNGIVYLRHLQRENDAVKVFSRYGHDKNPAD
jgi:hypothetical protein